MREAPVARPVVGSWPAPAVFLPFLVLGTVAGPVAVAVFGPVEVTASSPAWRRQPRVEFSLGHAF